MSWFKSEINTIALKARGMTCAVKYNTALARKELLSKWFPVIFLLNVITSCFSLTETSILEVLIGQKGQDEISGRTRTGTSGSDLKNTKA